MILTVDTAPHGVETPTTPADNSLTGIENDASAPWGGKGLMSGSEILQYIHNSDNPGTKTYISRVFTAVRSMHSSVSLVDCSLTRAHGSSARRETRDGPTTGLRRTCGGWCFIPRSETLSIFTTLRARGRKSRPHSGRYRPHGVETVTALADCMLVGAHGVSARQRLPLAPTSIFRRTRGRVPFTDDNSVHSSTKLQQPGTRTEIPLVSTTRMVWRP